MRIARRVRVDVGCLVFASLASACVDAYPGSSVQIDFAAAVQTNPRVGEVAAADQPPPNTHYVLYAVDHVFATNPDGSLVLDGNGAPVIKQTYLFSVKDFAIHAVVNLSSPCFIDAEGTRFPGLHVTQYAGAVRTATGITDPFATGQDPGDVSDVLTADRRNSNLMLIAGALKSVTSYSDASYPAVATGCVGQAGVDATQIPPASCVDAASNAQRLRLCQSVWNADPQLYEGSDKVFTLPLGGKFFGMVEGSNPVNGGFVGGSSFFVEENLVDFDAYLVNWQYDDLDHNGLPDTPAGVTASATGFPYLEGTPRAVTRGVITVPLHHATNPNLAATMAIFPNLNRDDVQF
jgi:hypothetical protein